MYSNIRVPTKSEGVQKLEKRQLKRVWFGLACRRLPELKVPNLLKCLLAVYCDQNNSYEITMTGYQASK